MEHTEPDFPSTSQTRVPHRDDRGSVRSSSGRRKHRARAFNTFGRESVEGARALTTQRLRVYLLGLSVLLGLIAAGYGMGGFTM